jgi:hypothetical protein
MVKTHFKTKKKPSAIHIKIKKDYILVNHRR